MNRNDIIEMILVHSIEQAVYSDLLIKSLETMTLDQLEAKLCLLEEAAM